MPLEKRTPHPGRGAAFRNTFTCQSPGYNSGTADAAQAFPEYMLNWTIAAWRRALVQRIFDRYDQTVRFDSVGRCWFVLRDCMWQPAHSEFVIEIQSICAAAARDAGLAGCRRLERSLASYTTVREIERKLRQRMLWPWPQAPRGGAA